MTKFISTQFSHVQTHASLTDQLIPVRKFFLIRDVTVVYYWLPIGDIKPLKMLDPTLQI